MREKLNVLMCASECRGIVKVGGLGDVVLDLSTELKKNEKYGINVKIILPYYDVVKVTGESVGEFQVEFGKINYKFSLYKTTINGVEIYLIKNGVFFAGEKESIYIDSDKYKRGPFEDDAKRFAFFSVCVCELLLVYDEFRDINILHNHDWHTGTIFLLLQLSHRYQTISNKFKKIFTIHNLEYQGIRPFYDTQYSDLSSFESWFPDLYKVLIKSKVYSKVISPKIFYPCYNPMRAGINLSDLVNTVSLTYASEILKKDNIKNSFFGGRGLERDLINLNKNGKLFGIINGIDYKLHDPNRLEPPFDSDNPQSLQNKTTHKREFITNLSSYIKRIHEEEGDRFINWERVSKKLDGFNYQEFIELPLYVTVSRVVSQKLGIFLEKYGKELVIDRIAEQKLLFIIVGTGELQEKLEFLNDFPNIFYIASYAPSFAEKLYHSGDFFVMPSYFEPCGISQLIALRYGTLPIVNSVGGLKDTVTHNKTGFVFGGKNSGEIKNSFIDRLKESINIYNNDKERLIVMGSSAMKERFDWERSVKEYAKLYQM